MLIYKFLNSITWVASILLGSVVLLMATQVFLRFAFNSPQAWAEEVDRYVFVWSIYLGTLIALIKKTHIRVTFLTDKMSSEHKNILELLCPASLIVFSYSFLNIFSFNILNVLILLIKLYEINYIRANGGTGRRVGLKIQ